MRALQGILLVVIGVLLNGSSARGDLIFDNGAPAAGTDLDFSDVDANQSLADDFTLAFADTIRSIVIFGSYFPNDTPPASDLFSVRFYSDDLAGSPDGGAGPIDTSALNGVSRVDTGLVSFGGDRIFRHELNLATPQALAAGTSFWLSVFNDTSGGLDPDDNWGWTAASRAGNGHASTAAGTSWTGTEKQYHFQLHNTTAIPEPSSLLLLGLIACGGAAYRWKKFKVFVAEKLSQV